MGPGAILCAAEISRAFRVLYELLRVDRAGLFSSIEAKKNASGRIESGQHKSSYSSESGSTSTTSAVTGHFRSRPNAIDRRSRSFNVLRLDALISTWYRYSAFNRCTGASAGPRMRTPSGGGFKNL